MPKFKKYDQIAAINCNGFEKATVLNIYTAEKGKFKGRQMYLLRIMNGTATVPVEAEINYQLVKDKK